MSLYQGELYEKDISNNNASYNNYFDIERGDQSSIYGHGNHQQQPQQRQPQQRQHLRQTWKKCQILLKEGGKLNRKMISYFRNNLAALNDKGIIFEWIPVYEEEIEYYEEQNIDRFPTLIIDNNNITGVNNIIQFLNNQKNGTYPGQNQTQGPAQNTQHAAQREQNENNTRQKNNFTSGDIREYFMSELNAEGQEETDDFDPHKKMATMDKERKNKGLFSFGGSRVNQEVREDSRPSKKVSWKEPESEDFKLKTEIKNIIKKTGDNSVDQDMLDSFWENQEETQL